MKKNVASSSTEIFWTSKDLNDWIIKNIIPSELLKPENWVKLSNFLKNNKEYCQASSRSNKRNSEKARKLTNKQNENLQGFVSKYGRETSKSEKYRQSGHLIDEKLKHSGQRKNKDIFDSISNETKQKIEESKIEVKVEGIKLTPPENKLLHALARILHEKSSNTKDSKSSGFYEGNAVAELVSYGKNKSKAEVLRFKPTELYKAYVGNKNYSGHDAKFINNILHQLENKKFLIRHDRVKKVKIGKTGKTKRLTDRIEEFQSLIRIRSFIPDLTDEEKQKLDRGNHSISEMKAEIIVVLNPIFTDQIDTKFVEFPVDTNRRLVIAAGGHKKVTSSMMTLMEWMHREISAKRYIIEINEDKLPYILGLDNYVKQRRKKKLQERISKDIEAITNMGIILQTYKESNSTKGYKWVFHLNENYE